MKVWKTNEAKDHFDEIHSIIIDDSIEIDIPKRSDRSNSTEEILYELSV